MVSAFLLWGLIPLYFSPVRDVPPVELLFHRIVWSFALILAILHFSGKTRAFKDAWRKPNILKNLLLTAFLIAINWFLYIISASTNQVQQASLGYYFFPTLSVLLVRFAIQEPMRLIH